MLNYTLSEFFLKGEAKAERMIGRQGYTIGVTMLIHHKKPTIREADILSIQSIGENGILTDWPHREDELRWTVILVVSNNFPGNRISKMSVKEVYVLNH